MGVFFLVCFVALLGVYVFFPKMCSFDGVLLFLFGVSELIMDVFPDPSSSKMALLPSLRYFF